MATTAAQVEESYDNVLFIDVVGPVVVALPIGRRLHFLSRVGVVPYFITK